MQLRPDVTIEGIDVLVRPNTAIPVHGFDGRTIPSAEDAFDAAIVVDVLHHTDDRYPPGMAMTSANTASYLIGATRLSAIGALYHRNNRGNIAVYRYFLGRLERSAAIARAWNVAYVAFCPGDFAEIDVMRAYPESLAAMLQSDRPPAGFERLRLRGARLRLYRVHH